MGLYMGGGGGLYTGGAYTRTTSWVNGKKTRCLLLNFSNFKQKIIEYCHQRDAIIFIVSIVSI